MMNRSSLMDEYPYGSSQQQYRRASQTIQRTGSQQKACGSLSDQKTPNAHPNSFLYRAHINLNELSSADQQANYNANGAVDSQQDDQFSHHFKQQLQLQADNISAFYSDDLLLSDQSHSQQQKTTDATGSSGVVPNSFTDS